ncbi:MAG: DUF4091 domain-containing protein [Solirubrobacterales bacterium]|nr:DUF4091 domain-containing protein [Solirubrobacterales bacterium]
MTVTTPQGTSTITPADQFTYSPQQLDPRVRVVGPTDKVRPQDTQAGGSSLSVTAAGNELVAFQVVVTATSGAITSFAASATGPLIGQQSGQQIPAQNIALYRIAYVETQQATFSSTAPASLGRWPDPLIPVTDPIAGEARNAFPITIPSGENRIAWVEVTVPPDLAADDYAGAVHITGIGLEAQVPLTISVLPFNLPATSRLASGFLASMDAACQALGYNIDTQGWEVLASFIRLGLNNRITISTMLRLLRGGGDDERANFERTILPLIAGSAGGLRLAGAQMTSIDTISGGNATELAAWRDEANAHGFADRAFVYDLDLCDEIVGTGKSWPACRDQRVRTVLSTWPQAAILLTASINDVNSWETDPNNEPGPLTTIDGQGGRLRLTVVIDQMYGKTGPYQGDQRPSYNSFLSNPNHSLWLYSSCDDWGCGASGPQDDGWSGGYVVDAPGARSRTMAWMCYRFQASGELYYDTAAKMQSAWKSGGLFNFGGNGDGTVFYPGTPNQDVGDGTVLGGTTAVPLESIRLKLICQGYQDYEYLAELAARGGDAQAIAEKYFPQSFEITATDTTFVQARQEIVTALRPHL